MVICRWKVIFATARGPQSAVHLTEEEYNRLLLELMNESKSGVLHQVDVAKGLIELNQNGCLPGDKQKV